MKTLVTIIVIIIVIVGIWFLVKSDSPAPVVDEILNESTIEDSVNESDSTIVIEDELNSIDIGDVDADLESIDIDLESL